MGRLARNSANSFWRIWRSSGSLLAVRWHGEGALVAERSAWYAKGEPTFSDCLALARQVTGLPGLRLEGITGYEGHCSLTRDNDLRHERQRLAMTFFTGVAALLEADGIPCPIRSAGGIATWNWTAPQTPSYSVSESTGAHAIY